MFPGLGSLYEAEPEGQMRVGMRDGKEIQRSGPSSKLEVCQVGT